MTVMPEVMTCGETQVSSAPLPSLGENGQGVQPLSNEESIISKSSPPNPHPLLSFGLTSSICSGALSLHGPAPK